MNAKENSSDDVDLGQLFKLIGNAFSACFTLIANIFKNVFHFFILLLQFIRVHFYKLVLAVFLGVIVGGVIDHNALPRYRSSMIVQPNFNSVQQLYNNIEFYDQLAKQQESKALAEALHISESAAVDVKKVVISSFSDQTQRIKQFSEFIQELDSVSQKQVHYEDYLKNFNDINAKFHKIEIETTSPGIAKKCQKAIVTSIENNEYFKLQKDINDDNIALRDSIIEQQQKEINDLQEFYKRIKVLEAKKPDGTTSINLAENKSDQVSELELLDHEKKLKDEKIKLNNEKANTKNTINIISEFPNKGALINDFFAKKIVLTPILFVSVLFLTLIMISLNKYLAGYN
ncbi:hypothetical protein [Aquimarina algiphila]|uniref:hypothetical protein n=1 Tax=Aquimarina algiphila TaxID=2047982 RepID=UPI00232F9B69|nr:hypothetical protein [Aquimarina algiphila]